jgi:hypothetical protein
MMATSRTQRQKQRKVQTIEEEELTRIYEPYRFLEADHWGQFLIVAPDGRYVVGPREGELLHEAVSKFGPGLTILKVGDVVAGTWPWYKEL